MQEEEFQVNHSSISKQPVLSLLCCSRNDQYMGNSLWRLQTALNFVAQSVFEVGREADVEVLVTDWDSEIPLHTVLRLSPNAARLVSFIIVPPALAKQIQGDSPFSEVYAFNAAARRSNGQYVGRIDQDTLVGTRFLRTFFELYEGKRQLDVPLDTALMLSNRYQIPYRFASRCPSFWEVDRFIRWFGQYLDGEMFHLSPHLFLRSYVGIWLVHRDVWHECGGYNERMKYYDWMETEMILRLMQQEYKVVDLGKLVNYDFYHLEHFPSVVPWSTYTNRKTNPGLDLENPPELDFQPSGEGWGLIKYPLEMVRYAPPRNAVATALSDQPRFKWPSFALLLLSTGVLIVWDKLFGPFVSRWKHRAKVAWETVRGQPVTKWPGVLKGLWVERQYRLRREE